MHRRIADIAASLVITPILVVGILLAFLLANRLFDISSSDFNQAVSVTWLGAFLVLVLICTYLGALVGYATIMLFSAAFLSKRRFDSLASRLPQRGRHSWPWLHAPFSAIGNLLYASHR